MRQILRGKTGASILFVLAAMALLMVIGVSTLTTASANIGERYNRQIHNRIDMYTESLQRTIRHSLEKESANDNGKTLDATVKTLGGQILRAAYGAGETATNVRLVLSHEITGADDAINIPDFNVTITVNVEPLYVNITPPQLNREFVVVPPDPDDASDEGRVDIELTRLPATAYINGTVRVNVSVQGNGKAVVTEAAYNLSGVYLEEEGGIQSLASEAAFEAVKAIGTMKISGAGDWGFVSYEKLDR